MTTSAIQALATGLPCITTTHSGFPEQIIHGQNGYLAREADPTDIAEKILTYMDETARWSTMSVVARRTMLERYDKGPLIKRQLACYRNLSRGTKVAFVIGVFPAISETFIINQIADLEDLGVEVSIYTFRAGDMAHISERYADHGMDAKTHVLDMPAHRAVRLVAAIFKFARIFASSPAAALRVLGSMWSDGMSVKKIFWVEPFLDLDADIVHCHFGTVANRFLIIRDLLKLSQPFITTFYGYDVSHIPVKKGISYYDRLKKESALFLTMSDNMKSRVEQLGFDPARLMTLPISIDVGSLPFAKRSLKEGEVLRMVSVGRFVEKKGFDDLLRAISIVKKRASRTFIVTIIGGGVLEQELKRLAHELNIEDVVRFVGYMKLEDIFTEYMGSHLYLQTSKTAKDGDME